MRFYNCLRLFCLPILLIGLVQSKESSSSKSKNSEKVVCNQAGLDKADLCGEKLFFVGKNARLFPTTESESEKYCSQTVNLVQCVKRFTDKCSHNELQRNLANVMLYTVRSHHKGVCGSKAKKAQLMTMAKCANTIRKKSTECMNKMLIEFGNGMGLKEGKYRIPYACCSFHKMRNCISSAADKANREICNPKATEIFEQYIGNMAGNTLELMCSEYDSDSDRCATIKKMPYDPKKAKPPKSLLVAFGDLLLAEPSK